jgi:hypothetical protein
LKQGWNPQNVPMDADKRKDKSNGEGADWSCCEGRTGGRLEQGTRHSAKLVTPMETKKPRFAGVGGEEEG